MPAAPVKNPLRIDPSRTKTLRRSMTADMNKRMRKARNHVLSAMDLPDWKGRTKAQQIADLKRRAREATLTLFGESKKYNLRPWYERGFQRAMQQGVERAFNEGKQQFESEEQKFGARRYFVKEVGRMYHERQELFMDKARADLKNISQHLVTEVERIAADGIRNGRKLKDIKAQITNVYNKAMVKRTKAFIEVSIVGAHADGQLDGWEHLGEHYVGIRAEWKTAGDLNVCPLCEKKEGRVFTINKARGMIPLHIGCRCAWVLIKKKGK